MILVVGYGRSGTTTTATILERDLGVDMGSGLPGSDHQEDPVARHIHIQLRSGRMPEEEAALWLQGHAAERAVDAGWAEWGVKDPRASHAIHLWRAIEPTLLLVACIRDPRRTADRWREAWGIPRPTALREILARAVAIQRACPDLVLDFDTHQPEARIRDLLEGAIARRQA